MDNISNLIRKKLIFPYIKLKNLGLEDKIYILLPAVKKESIDTLIKIFNYFNFSFIYEIEGDLFINGFDDMKHFENGLYMKIYFPRTDISEFQQVFAKIFQYFSIEKYLLLKDMINGENLLKNVFDNSKDLESFNPLKNLKWNTQDKIWTNDKSFGTGINDPLYPALIPDEADK